MTVFSALTGAFYVRRGCHARLNHTPGYTSILKSRAYKVLGLESHVMVFTSYRTDAWIRGVVAGPR